MKLVWYTTLTIAIATVIYAQQDPRSLLDPKIQLDPKLRKALIRVLSDLDKDSTEKLPEASSTTDEKSKYPKKVFNIHAFGGDQLSGETSHTNTVNEEDIEFDISKNISPIQVETERIVGSASTDSQSVSRSIDNTIEKNEKDNNFVTAKTDEKEPSPTAATIKNDLSEGFNEGKVEEVQFFPAPLVAAFTVRQDEQGFAHSVIPLYKNENSQSRSVPSTNENIKSQQLEQQLQLLQQQRQQELYQQIRQQEIEEYRLRNQQDQIRQHLRLQEQQQRLFRQQQEEQQRRLQLKLQEENQRFRSQNLRPSNQFTFQQSISSVQQPLLYQQQLPAREAVDFLTNLRQNVNDLPLEQNHIPSNFNRALPPLQQIDSTRNQQVQIQPSVQFQQPSKLFEAPKTLFDSSRNQLPVNDNLVDGGRNRVFRHQDGQIGNFGVNNQFTREFRPNYRLADQQLQTLLVQSGVGQVGGQDDLNIVSKVLSLNHLGGNLNGFFKRSDNGNVNFYNN